MTTAELAGKINIESYWDRPCGGTGSRLAGRKRRAVRTAGKEAAPRSLPDRLLLAAVKRLERNDTPADKVTGYGLCGITMFYLTAHLIKAVFN